MKEYIEFTEKIAAEYRKQRKIPVIGITGSVGKTTVKELASQILMQKYCVHKNEESCNGNDTVVRNTLSIRAEHQVCVFELGIDDFGQMERMVQCCRPTIPVLTGISSTHLEKLENSRNIYDEKSHIFDTLPKQGKVIANGDDENLMRYLYEDSRIPNENIYTYGLSEQCMLRAEKIISKGLYGSTFTVSGKEFISESFEAEIKLPGTHMVQNAVAAILIGLLFDVPVEQIVYGLKMMAGTKQRCQVMQNGNLTIIDDSYNASPEAVKAALNLLKQAEGRKVCILGDMNELGDAEKALHEDIGRYADLAADETVFIGTLAEYMYYGAKQQNHCGKISWYADKDSFMERCAEHITARDTVLIKASHKQEFWELSKKVLAAI